MSTGARASGAGGRLNTVGLSERELSGVLGRLEGGPPAKPGRGVKRVFARWPFPRTSVDVSVIHPGGSKTELSMACRNLSRGGIGLLHSAYMYPGSRVTVRLPRLDGREAPVEGVVARCEHRQGIIHEIGVRFDHEVRLRDHVRPDVFSGWVSFEQIDGAALEGSVVHVEPSAMDQKIVKHFLRDTAVRVRSAGSVAEALESIRSGCDVIVCEHSLPDGCGAALVRRLRSQGVGTPVVLVGAEPTGVARDEVVLCGANAFVPKPFTQETLLLALGEFLIGGHAEQAAPAGDRPAQEVARAYAARLRELGGELETLVAQDRPIDAYVICSQIRAIAPALGFDAVSQRAEWLAGRLSTGEGVGVVLGEARELARACRDLRGA